MLAGASGIAGYAAMGRDVLVHERELERQRALVEQVPVLVSEIRGLRADIVRIESALQQIVSFQISARHRTAREDG
jgi:hypothetical protein